jgi:hypothetical protein
MVGRRTLDAVIGVRIPVPQPIKPIANRSLVLQLIHENYF